MGFEGKRLQALIVVALVLGVLAPLAIHMLPFGGEAVRGVEEPQHASRAEEASGIEVVETIAPLEKATTIQTGGVESYKQLLETLEAQRVLIRDLGSPLPVIRPLGATVTVATPTATPEAGEAVAKAPSGGVIGTNVQVVGVDESDVADIMGPLVASIHDGNVVLYSLEDLSVASVIKAPEGFRAWGLMSNGKDVLVVLFKSVRGPESVVTIKVKVESGGKELEIPMVKAPATLVKVYDVTDPASPVEMHSFEMSGWPVAARMEGDAVIVVTQGAGVSGRQVEIGVPSVGGRPVPPTRIILGAPGPVKPLNVLVANVSTGSIDSYTLYTFPNPRIYYNSGYLVVAASGFTTEPIARELLKAYADAIAEVDPEASSRILELVESGRLFKAIEVAVESFKRLDKEAKTEILNMLSRKLMRAAKEGLEDATMLHVFKVDSSRIEYIGSTRLPGSLLDQFAVELKDGYLVVATTLHKVRGVIPLPAIDVRIINLPPEMRVKDHTVVVKLPTGELVTIVLTSEAGEDEELARVFRNILATPLLFVFYDIRGVPEYTNVYIVSPEDLEVKASVEGIGEGMRLYAARLWGDMLFIVSYRLVDPLYAVDLSDPLNPRLVGKLKVPGFSEYLHPVSEGLLLGVGISEKRWASKVSLYKVIDPVNMEELASMEIEGLWPLALKDYHAFAYDPEYQRVFLPSALNRFMKTGSAVIVVKVLGSEPWLDLEKVVEVEGALRVFAWNNYVAIVAKDKLVVLDRASLEEVEVIEAAR